MGGLGALGMMAGGGALFVNRPEFGRAPRGERLARMESSPHYMNGQFQNLVPVQVMNEQSGENRFVAMAKFLFVLLVISYCNTARVTKMLQTRAKFAFFQKFIEFSFFRIPFMGLQPRL